MFWPTVSCGMSIGILWERTVEFYKKQGMDLPADLEMVPENKNRKTFSLSPTQEHAVLKDAISEPASAYVYVLKMSCYIACI